MDLLAAILVFLLLDWEVLPYFPCYIRVLDLTQVEY